MSLLLSLSCVLMSSAGADPASSLELWKDPKFQKEFLGSYGVNSELEPRVTQAEKAQLEKVIPLLASDPAKAREELEKLATPDVSAVFDYTLGNLYFQENRLEDAAKRWRSAVDKFPSFRRALKNLGLVEVRTGDFPAALRSLSRVVELGGGDGLTFGLLGYAHASTEQYVSAESAYRSALLLQPDTLDWKLGLTQTVFKERKYGEAAELCDELIAKYPDRSEFWLLQANAFIGLNQPLKAAQNFEIVRRMGKATPASLNTLGDIYVNEGMYDLAASAYAGSLEADASQPVTRPLRNVEALAQRGALDPARELTASVRKAYEGRLVDDDRRKLLKLEARIAVADGSDDKAAEVLEQVIAVDPLDGEALLLLGQHYARHDDPDRAIFYYERAASLEGFEADAKVRQAQVLVSQARFGEAVPLLKRAQELKPRDDVGRYLDQVEKLARGRR